MRGGLPIAALLLLAACGEPTAPPDGPGDGQPALGVVALRVEPTVTRSDEPFRLSLQVTGAAGALVVGHPVEVLGLLRDRVVQDSLLFRDDGTQGDDVAGDGWFTTDGLVLPVPPEGVAAVTLSGFTSLHEPGGAHGGAVGGLRASFRTGDPAVVGSPAVVDVADGVRATGRVVAITDPDARGLDEEDVDALAGRYYALFPDDRDFVVLSIPPTAGAEWSARAYETFNDIGGIGLPRARWRRPGSAERLSILVHARMDVYTLHEDGRGSFCLLTHELAHRWVAYVGSPLANDSGHWNAGTLDRATSALGDAVGCVFNDLELYLSGLLPADSVADPLTQAGYTVDQLLAAQGPRSPAFGDAPTSFTIGFVVVSEAPLSDFEIAWFDHMAGEYTAPSSALATNWVAAVDGRAHLDPLLPLPAQGR